MLLALNARNRRLSSFWLTDQGGSAPDPRLAGRSVVILDGEDDFVNMLRHLLGVLGLSSRVVRHEEYVAGALDGADLVIVGPGPGDPRDDADPKMGRLRAAVADAARRRPAVPRGLPRPPGAVPPARAWTWRTRTSSSRARSRRSASRAAPSGSASTTPSSAGSATRRCRTGVVVEADPDSGDIHALRGPHYRGIQFHAESILTEHGYDLLHDIVGRLLLEPVSP